MARIKIDDLPSNSTLSRDDLRKVCGGWIASVSWGSGSVNAFPDICKTPSPGGPVPVPFPNIGMTSGTSGGTTKVKSDGGQTMTKGGSYSLSGGDESGTE